MTKFMWRRFVCVLLFLHFFLLESYGKASEVCISKGGRFPHFSSEGKPPKKVSNGHRDLTVCRVFRRRTCCDINQTWPVILSIRRLASAGNGSQECMQLWELLECSICDPWVGVKPGIPRICLSFCDTVYNACSLAFFSMDQKKQVLVPCDERELLCAQLSEWVSNGKEFCHHVGFSVDQDDDTEDISCYGGKGSMEYVQKSWKRSDDDKSSSADMNLGDSVQWISWAAIGIFIVVALVLASQGKSRNRRNREQVVQRVGRKLGTRSSSSDQVKRTRMGQ